MHQLGYHFSKSQQLSSQNLQVAQLHDKIDYGPILLKQLQNSKQPWTGPYLVVSCLTNFTIAEMHILCYTPYDRLQLCRDQNRAYLSVKCIINVFKIRYLCKFWHLINWKLSTTTALELLIRWYDWTSDISIDSKLWRWLCTTQRRFLYRKTFRIF